MGGERLHHWVMGGPWTYQRPRSPDGMVGVDREFYDALVARTGSVVVGRGRYDAAGAWGGRNPFPGRLFVVTHGLDDAPPAESGFTFVPDLATAVAWAVLLGAGKRLFDGSTHDLDLTVLAVHSSPYATHVRYAVGAVA